MKYQVEWRSYDGEWIALAQYHWLYFAKRAVKKRVFSAGFVAAWRIVAREWNKGPQWTWTIERHRN